MKVFSAAIERDRSAEEDGKEKLELRKKLQEIEESIKNPDRMPISNALREHLTHTLAL